MSITRSGGCLCGAVKFQATLNDLHVHVCHCKICQKWSGSSGLSLKCEGWDIQGDKNLTWYDSSETARRGFCKLCGSHLFFQTNDNSYKGISAGALDLQEGLSLDSHIFIDKKPGYYDFKDDVPRLTEAEFLAQFENVEL